MFTVKKNKDTSLNQNSLVTQRELLLTSLCVPEGFICEWFYFNIGSLILNFRVLENEAL